MSDVAETSSGRMQGEASERCSRTRKQADPEYILKHLTEEQKLAASQSLTVYCQPVEIYNRIRDRPRFLQRCLNYNIKENQKKRIEMTVSLSWKVEYNIQSLFPLCICLGKLDPNNEPTGAAKYHVGRISTIQGPSGIDCCNGNNHVRVNFILPQQEKLDVKTDYDEYFLFILASAENPISLSTINPVEMASNESSGGETIIYGKVSLKFLYDILDISPDYPLKHRTEIQFSAEFRSCNLKYCLQHWTRKTSGTISIQDSNDCEMEGLSKILHISTGFQECGGPRKLPPRWTRKGREEASSSSSLPHINWLPGHFAFHYRYYHNKLRKIEVTENFTCAICLVKCTDYKSLKLHLMSSHEIFRFEFSESEQFPSVSVSLKYSNWKQELVDPKLDTFMYCGKKPKRRNLKTLSQGIFDPEGQNLSVGLPIEDGRAPSIADSDNGSEAMEQDILEEVSNAMLQLGSSVFDLNVDLNTALEVDDEQVSNAISHSYQGSVPLIPDQYGTHGVLEAYNEEVSRAIVLYTGQNRIPPMSDQDCEMLEADNEEVSNAIVLYTGQGGVPPNSDQECEMLEVDQNEEISNAIVLYTGQGRVPPISDQYGTSRVLELGHEVVPNAIVLHTGQDCVPPISNHDNRARAVLDDHVSNATILHTGQDRVSPTFNHDNRARAALQDDVSNAIILHAGVDSVSSKAIQDEGTSSMPQVEEKEEKEKTLSELFDPDHLARWKKRTFYHSHTHMAMALEEVVMDEDSEDEINVGAGEIEEKRKLELLGISDDQKRFQSMWCSFIKKHRVVADGHMNWAYQAFTKYHRAELAVSPALAWCWRLFMIKLYDQGLLKRGIVRACSRILQHHQRQKMRSKS